MKKLLLIAILFATISCSNNDIKLNANVKKTTYNLIVKNEDAFSWENVIITINGEYEYKCEKIEPLEEKEINFLEFTDNSQNKLNVFEKAIKDVTISASTLDKKIGFISFSFK